MRILIADDDDVSRLALEALLTRNGHEVVAVADGAHAWEILQGKDPPRLAVLDWLMEKMDGVEVCRRVRERPELRGIYLVLLTSRGDKEHILAGIQAGANDYVTKPYHRDELLARLKVGVQVLGLQAELRVQVHEA
jgi:DNA-binding response OmpR family regulator